jgi:hypothetical protein
VESGRDSESLSPMSLPIVQRSRPNADLCTTESARVKSFSSLSGAKRVAAAASLVDWLARRNALLTAFGALESRSSSPRRSGAKCSGRRRRRLRPASQVARDLSWDSIPSEKLDPGTRVPPEDLPQVKRGTSHSTSWGCHGPFARARPRTVDVDNSFHRAFVAPLRAVESPRLSEAGRACC